VSSHQITYSNDLVIGWRLESSGATLPSFYIRTDFDITRARDEDLVLIDRRTVAAHTAVIAQSGSGKSFFLGRLVEELLLKTRCRCTILDPNSDFRHVDKVNSDIWTQDLNHDRNKHPKLTLESHPAQFESLWATIQKSIAVRERVDADSECVLPARLWWPSMNSELIAAGFDERAKLDIASIHRLVQMIDTSTGAHLDACSQALQLIRSANVTYTKGASTHDSLIAQVVNHATLQGLPIDRDGLRAQAKMAAESPEGLVNYYMKLHDQMRASKMLAESSFTASQSLTPPARLSVVDLPSFDEKARGIIIQSFLDALWQARQREWADAQRQPASADSRSPHFLVIDEAHNLIPSDPKDPIAVAILSRLRTIAAEGRKFGLFLIIVSQRADKLDSRVLSECENFGVLRVSQVVSQQLQKLIDDPRFSSSEIAKLGYGCAILCGRWRRNSDQPLYSSARRTLEGGRGLQADMWAQPTAEVAIASKNSLANDRGK